MIVGISSRAMCSWAESRSSHSAAAATAVLHGEVLREILRCPVTGTELEDASDASGAPVLVSTGVDAERGGRLQYPIRDGIPVLLADDASVLPV